MAADRYGASNRATAAIATAALIDFVLIAPEDQSLVTDKNKVARAREKYRRQLQMEERKEQMIFLVSILMVDMIPHYQKWK